ncbi:MAG: hypothetical protein JNK35_07370, partial [Phycisphaerae bacterium]|nr:hypothetical protein [Phycisphaerae bacterium]
MLAGIAVLVATVLIPARRDLEETQFYLERGLLVEQHRLNRLERYVGFLDALGRGDESTVLALAATQLNAAPAGSALLVASGEVRGTSASVFEGLEPPPLDLPQPAARPSTLESWCLDATARLWLTAGGALCVLIGLLPASTSRRPTA